MRNWYTTQELAGLPGLPGTVPGVRKVAVRLEWESRKRLASKAIEYSFTCLPPETQSAILAKAVAEVEAPKESVSSALIEISKERDAKNTSRLNDIQREVMLARLAFIREIERMSVHVSQRAAIDLLVNL
ncbi:hypothetical protein IMW75_14070 [Pseudomonas gregormendelii]|uniref:HTH Mu-type domain-containing protein n=1 Tax=Pseudomonas gregormendelii TaxID=1628277 RepID=A0ABS3AGW4_9PSED|nr:DNA-binding protein [Pseudomonas gregormendelii]MBN3966394.1 hypothetical protein [Pseudomonas gregormendelii]